MSDFWQQIDLTVNIVDFVLSASLNHLRHQLAVPPSVLFRAWTLLFFKQPPKPQCLTMAMLTREGFISKVWEDLHLNCLWPKIKVRVVAWFYAAEFCQPCRIFLLQTLLLIQKINGEAWDRTLDLEMSKLSWDWRSRLLDHHSPNLSVLYQKSQFFLKM